MPMQHGLVAAGPPRLSRRAVLGAAAAGVTLLTLRPTPSRASGDVAATIVARINQLRTERGLHALPVDGHLATVAAGWSARMAGGAGLAHNPDHRGQYGWATEDAREVVGYASASGASVEELALRVVQVWMGSGGHRGIILGAGWTDLGVGCVRAADGRLYATANVIRAELPAAAAEGLALSQELIPGAGAPRIVLASTDAPADALAAAVLLDATSPMLLARPGMALPAALVAEISRAATAQTAVYLVGDGLPVAVEEQVRATGAQPVRLAGSSRYDTAAAVAAESARVRWVPTRLHLVRADQWADAVSVAAQAARQAAPILLVDRDGVSAATQQVLDANPGAERVVVGGQSGIADAVVQAVGGYRIAGEDRSGTGVAVMQELWGRGQATAGDQFVVTPGWTSDGWATALVHTSYSAGRGAPLLFSAEGVPPLVREALQGAGYTAGTAGVTRFARGVPAAAQQEYRALIGG